MGLVSVDEASSYNTLYQWKTDSQWSFVSGPESFGNEPGSEWVPSWSFVSRVGGLFCNGNRFVL